MKRVSTLIKQLVRAAGGNQGTAAKALALAVKQAAHPKVTRRKIGQTDISRWASGTRVPEAMADVAIRSVFEAAEKKAKILSRTP